MPRTVTTRVLARLSSRGVRRGLLGGSKAWTYVGVAAFGLRVGRFIFRDRPEVLWRAKLRPGDGLEIRTRPPARRR